MDQETYRAHFRKLQDLSDPLKQSSGRENLCFPSLTFFSDPTRTSNILEIAEQLPYGSGFIYRHFGAQNALLIAQQLRIITHRRGVKLIIGNDVVLGLDVEADGMHFSHTQLLKAESFYNCRSEGLMSVACHNIKELKQIIGTQLPFDAVFISPVFNSQSPSARNRTPLGLKGVKNMNDQSCLPLYGLGGISKDNIPVLKGTGLCGVGGIDLFLI